MKKIKDWHAFVMDGKIFDYFHFTTLFHGLEHEDFQEIFRDVKDGELL